MGGWGGGLIPPTPFLWAFSESKISCGAFSAGQFRPKILFGAFGASNNSGSPEAPPPPAPICAQRGLAVRPPPMGGHVARPTPGAPARSAAAPSCPVPPNPCEAPSVGACHRGGGQRSGVCVCVCVCVCAPIASVEEVYRWLRLPQGPCPPGMGRAAHHNRMLSDPTGGGGSSHLSNRIRPQSTTMGHVNIFPKRDRPWRLCLPAATVVYLCVYVCVGCVH